MPSPTTALTLIEDALGLTNAVGVDQTLTADEVSDCLRVFNDVLEDGSTQNMFVYGQANQTFNTVNGQAVYTIGTGGNWNTTWPVNIEDVAYATINGASFPFRKITQEQYNLIAVKAQAQEFPEFFLYVNVFPLGLVTLWPVPNAVTALTFSINRVLANVTSAGTTLSFPPGYAKAFKYRMGVELAPLFGKKITQYPDVMKIAQDTWADVKRANRKRVVMHYDQAFGDGGGFGYWQRGY